MVDPTGLLGSTLAGGLSSAAGPSFAQTALDNRVITSSPFNVVTEGDLASQKGASLSSNLPMIAAVIVLGAALVLRR